MINALAIFWIIVTVLTTASLGVVTNPNITEVFAQGNNTGEMMTYGGNMTSTTNATSTDDCDENATTDDCDSGSISRSNKGRIIVSPTIN